MLSILHIHAGDHAAVAARAAGIHGDVVAWHDSAAVGPCSRYRSRHLYLRSRFWGVDLDAISRPEELWGDRERALWFGPDPWEQLQLLELLACMPDGDCSLVPLPDAAFRLTAAGLAAAFAARRSASTLRFLAAALWFDFCDGELAGLERRLRRANHETRLPYLVSAVQRVLRAREGQPAARAVADHGGAGNIDLPALIEVFRARAFDARDVPQRVVAPAAA